MNRVTGLPKLSEEEKEALEPIADELRHEKSNAERSDGKSGGYGTNKPGMKTREP